MRNSLVHRVYVVVPVYQGARTLPELMAEVAGLTSEQQTRNGHCFIVSEVLLVHDCGPDRSDPQHLLLLTGLGSPNLH